MMRTALGAGAVTLTLARPERGNALNAELVESLLAGVQAACDDDGVHTLVLRGEGKHFCTGLDLSDLDMTSDGELLHRLVRIETLLAAVWHAPMRTVAVAQGRTWGAGADLFTTCEQRLAYDDTSFRFPGAQFGIVLGTRRLAQRVGAERARAVVADGGTWDVTQARAAGLVNAGPDADTARPVVDAPTARALRAATVADHRDQDLAALVRSAAAPGLVARVRAYRERLRAAG